MGAALHLDRGQVLAHRRRAGGLDVRLPAGPDAVARAAWAGLADSVPRAALLSVHARVAATTSSAWHDPPLVQLWGPRFSVHAVAEHDRAVFSLARLPTAGARRRLAEDLAERLDALLDGREMPYGDAGRALGVHHNQLRYAATTGRVLVRWDGARQPLVRTVPRPDVDPVDARHELARRYLHVLGPATADGFGRWAGLVARTAAATFEALRPELTPVRTDVGEAWLLSRDEPDARSAPGPTAPARLLPSGDAFWLLWGRDRELVVPDAGRRSELWTPRVWPGAVLVDGDVVGTWRRADETVTVSPWHPLPDDARAAVEAEAGSMPLPGLRRPVDVRWTT
ncbi:DNA glycosylase AlkZ-like family protein [uncultured Cellulomonas sp.]|uniref:DNA glycosylase AlkZ-like family protein n=1 Tax=uncultured Cellulomonas sp. TaxID=189682 RepID=UPI00260ABAB2|nr:crosslink repair DNA glycosylase YcaQ family protein [uncultured Cellulomonas sp.]